MFFKKNFFTYGTTSRTLAPTGGATLRSVLPFLTIVFQSTHPRGVRPARLHLLRSGNQFQSTHPRGVRRGLPSNHIDSRLFQSTHPRGVRPYCCFYGFQPISFNPRTREGCDIKAYKLGLQNRVSIHAPARGATLQVLPAGKNG